MTTITEISKELENTEVYMNVEQVLRFLHNRNMFIKNAGTPQQMTILPCTQFTIGDCKNNFFKAKDVAERIGASMFRIMECEVTQYHLKNKPEFPSKPFGEWTVNDFEQALKAKSE